MAADDLDAGRPEQPAPAVVPGAEMPAPVVRVVDRVAGIRAPLAVVEVAGARRSAASLADDGCPLDMRF